jgi:DNA-binding CsgD family transcriptional regulator
MALPSADLVASSHPSRVVLSEPAIARVAMMTARTRLTRGALEVALLAAAGRSNKQIAADMSLSVRTVENRLQRVYEELGVPGRHHLTDVFGVRLTIDLAG